MAEPQAALQAEASLSVHQSRIIHRLFSVWLWIVGGASLAIAVVYALSGFAYQFLGVLIGALLVTASVWWGRRSLGTPQFRLSLPSIVVALYLTSGILALFFPAGLYSFFATTILNMLLVALASKENLIAWLGGMGTFFFILFAILEGQGLVEALHFMPGTASNILVPVLMACVIPVAGVFTYLLTKTLRQSLNEAEQRSIIAETARTEQAATLAQVEQQAAEQARLLDLVRDLETPVIPLLEGVLVLPIVGHLDTLRLTNLTHALLERVAEERAHTVVIDVTAVSIIDTATANHLIQLTKGVRLLGAECIMTGIRADVAQTLVSLGVTWGSVKTAASLRDGLTHLLEAKV